MHRASAMMVTMAVAMTAMPAAADDEARRAEALGRLAKRRILFGHQSVGGNIVEGLGRLAAAGGGALRIAEVRAPAGAIAPGTFAHAYVGTNGDPAAKLRAFDELLTAMPSPPDLAMVKFCWADFAPGADVDGLFRTYQERLADLARRFPRTTFVHVTVPLTTVQTGPKAWVKKLLGRAPYGAAENPVREAFNARLRSAYGGSAPLFDLARLEATRLDGTLATTEWNGKPVLELAAAYTDDGGHLNAPGQDRIARAMVEYLASVP